MRSLCTSTLFLLASAGWGDDGSVKKVLLIGIDGCRTDALLAADAPNLHRLIKEGAFSKRNDVIGERTTGADTLSGPGWTSMLTGVWADKHGVKDNGFSGGPSRYRTFFSRLSAKAESAAFVSWKALEERVFGAGEGCRLVLDGSLHGFDEADQLVADAARKVLAEQDPAALFVFFGQVDAAGHQHGFHPDVRQYAAAIARVDRHVGKVLGAVKGRASHDREDWLIIVATDHGGRGLTHRGGRGRDEVRWTFLILAGQSVKAGPIEEPTANVDVAFTALVHLGVHIEPAWKFDGRCVGLKTKSP